MKKKFYFKNKLLLVLFFIVTGTGAFAQLKVGDNPATISSSAVLDVESTNKGLLVPRVALTGRTDISTITSPAISLLVYNTATMGTAPNNVVPGYYFFDGSAWQKMGISSEPWYSTTTGTDATTVSENIYHSGNVGIGTTLPSTKLHVESSTAGALQIKDGTQGLGKVLSSNVDGVAYWKNIGGSFEGLMTIPGTYSNSGTGWKYTGARIDLTIPGTYSVNLSTYLHNISGTPMWYNISLSTSNLSYTPLSSQSPDFSLYRMPASTDAWDNVFDKAFLVTITEPTSIYGFVRSEGANQNYNINTRFGVGNILFLAYLLN